MFMFFYCWYKFCLPGETLFLVSAIVCFDCFLNIFFFQATASGRREASPSLRPDGVTVITTSIGTIRFPVGTHSAISRTRVYTRV